MATQSPTHHQASKPSLAETGHQFLLAESDLQSISGGKKGQGSGNGSNTTGGNNSGDSKITKSLQCECSCSGKISFGGKK
jgi:hypothetical protein